MDVTTPAFRIKLGTIMIIWAVSVATIAGYSDTFQVETGIVNTVFITGAALVSGGLVGGIINRNKPEMHK